MSSYRQLLYHIVFRTYDSQPTIKQDYSDQLYAYITGIIKNHNSHLYRINGMENHLHILTDLHPSFPPANIISDIKAYSSKWMKKSDFFPDFTSWSEGYAALTCSYMSLDRLIEYVKNQQEHHRKMSFEEEYRTLLKEAGIDIDERFFP
jgi:putative transposase